MAREIGYSVPKEESLEFWNDRFNELKVNHQSINERFQEKLYLQFEDPDGLLLNLIVSNTDDSRKP